MKKKILYLILMMAPAWAGAQNKPYRVGTTAANFLEMGVGSAANAMGEAYVSQARDLSSIYWNPAGLAYLERSEVLCMYHPWIAGINVSFAGTALLLPRIGASATVILPLFGQVVGGLVIDVLGAFGTTARPLTVGRVIGVVLVAAGAVLVNLRPRAAEKTRIGWSTVILWASGIGAGVLGFSLLISILRSRNL